MFTEKQSRDMIEAVISMAKMNKCYYEGLIQHGFTKEQALELTKEHGFSLQRLIDQQGGNK